MLFVLQSNQVRKFNYNDSVCVSSKFILNQFLCEKNRFTFESKFQQDCHNIETHQFWYNSIAEQFIVVYSFTVKIYNCTKKIYIIFVHNIAISI